MLNVYTVIKLVQVAYCSYHGEPDSCVCYTSYLPTCFINRNNPNVNCISSLFSNKYKNSFSHDAISLNIWMYLSGLSAYYSCHMFISILFLSWNNNRVFIYIQVPRYLLYCTVSSLTVAYSKCVYMNKLWDGYKWISFNL